jgi:hypothetical protein
MPQKLHLVAYKDINWRSALSLLEVFGTYTCFLLDIADGIAGRGRPWHARLGGEFLLRYGWRHSVCPLGRFTSSIALIVAVSNRHRLGKIKLCK